jgi:hypothetical protein
MKEGDRIFREVSKVFKPVEWGPPVENHKNKIILGKGEIKALRNYLQKLEILEKEVFPKIKITFDVNLQPVK